MATSSWPSELRVDYNALLPPLPTDKIQSISAALDAAGESIADLTEQSLKERPGATFYGSAENLLFRLCNSGKEGCEVAARMLNGPAGSVLAKAEPGRVAGMIASIKKAGVAEPVNLQIEAAAVPSFVSRFSNEVSRNPGRQVSNLPQASEQFPAGTYFVLRTEGRPYELTRKVAVDVDTGKVFAYTHAVDPKHVELGILWRPWDSDVIVHRAASNRVAVLDDSYESEKYSGGDPSEIRKRLEAKIVELPKHLQPSDPTEFIGRLVDNIANPVVTEDPDATAKFRAMRDAAMAAERERNIAMFNANPPAPGARC